MNFDSIDKLSSKKVTNILLTNEEAKATRRVLIITRYILDAFLDKSIRVEKRIYFMWYSTLFLRLWRYWIKTTGHSLSKNFLTLNAYICIELNSHALLLAVEKCRSRNSPEAFLPWLYSSQTCEKLFRQIRSMTSTFSTVVNFDMYEIITRLNKIQTINDITNDIGK